MEKLPRKDISVGLAEYKNEEPILHCEHSYYTEFPYNQITAEDIVLVADDVILRMNSILERVISSDELTWEGVISPLNEISKIEADADGKAFFLAYVHPDRAVRQAAEDEKERVSHHSTAMWNQKDFYEKVIGYSKTKEAKKLKDEEQMCLQGVISTFESAGHLTPEKTRERITTLTNKISENGKMFNRNIKEDQSVVLLNSDELLGVPRELIHQFDKDEFGNHQVKLSEKKYLEVMRNAAVRDTRKKLYYAYNSRAAEENYEILKETVGLKLKLAKALGRLSWAEVIIETGMAGTTNKVGDFFARLAEPLVEKGRAEIAVMEDMLIADGFDVPVKEYDFVYYDARLQERIGVNQDTIAEYFSDDLVIQGMLDLTGEMFNLKYRKIDIPVWHEDVVAYAIDDESTGEQIASFYLDLYKRDGKYQGGLTYPLRLGHELSDGSYRQPEAAVVLNFPPLRPDMPNLLELDNVIDLFHEFAGHALHVCLSRTKMIDFSGTRVEGDFVEVPPQVMENLFMHPEILKRISKHYKTGEQLSDEHIENIIRSQKLNSSVKFLGKLSLTYLDLALHNGSNKKNLDKITRMSQQYTLFDHEEGTFFPASFDHLMDYDGRYYAYPYGKAYSDDIFEVIKEVGLVDKKVWADYRRIILEKGGTVGGEKMSRQFLGRKPNIKAFLNNLGV